MIEPDNKSKGHDERLENIENIKHSDNERPIPALHAKAAALATLDFLIVIFLNPILLRVKSP